MGVPKESCVCTALQDMDWEALEGLIEVFVDWWTLSYLKPADISKVLEECERRSRPQAFSSSAFPSSCERPAEVVLRMRV